MEAVESGGPGSALVAAAEPAAVPPAAASAKQRSRTAAVAITLERGQVCLESGCVMRSSQPLMERELVDAFQGSFKAIATDGAPPLDALAPTLYRIAGSECVPAVPCLQLADFALCDETGQPVATEWLCRLLGGPGSAQPPTVQPTLDEGARAEAAQAALSLAVRVELGVRRMGGQELRAPARRRKPDDGRANRRAAAGEDDEADEQGEEEGGEEEEDTSNWACCDRCGKWRRLPDGLEYEADSLPEEWFCEMNPDGRRATCQKPEERMGREEEWDGTLLGEDEGEEGEEGGKEGEGDEAGKEGEEGKADKEGGVGAGGGAEGEEQGEEEGEEEEEEQVVTAAMEFERMEKEARRRARIEMTRKAEDEQTGKLAEIARLAAEQPDSTGGGAPLAKRAKLSAATAAAETDCGTKVEDDDLFGDKAMEAAAHSPPAANDTDDLYANEINDMDDLRRFFAEAAAKDRSKRQKREAEPDEAAAEPAGVVGAAEAASSGGGSGRKRSQPAWMQEHAVGDEAVDAGVKEAIRKPAPKKTAAAEVAAAVPAVMAPATLPAVGVLATVAMVAAERAATRRPEGALVVRGLLVPAGAEGDVARWKHIEAGPLLGWTLQLSGRQRRTSLWVRTQRAWYWLRCSPPFAPAAAFRPLWAPPGAEMESALAEQHLLCSPVVASYAAAERPPPRAAAADSYFCAGGDDVGRSFRLASFALVGAEGAADLFSLMPRGAPLVAAPSEVSLLGQLLPAAAGAADDGVGGGGGGGGGADAWPTRLWLRAPSVVEWRLHVEEARGVHGGGPAAAPGAALRVWVRSACGTWYLLKRPHASMESAWKLPGASASRPVADAMTPPCFTTAPGKFRFNHAGAPCRLLTAFSLFTRGDGGGGGGGGGGGNQSEYDSQEFCDPLAEVQRSVETRRRGRQLKGGGGRGDSSGGGGDSSSGGDATCPEVCAV